MAEIFAFINVMEDEEEPSREEDYDPATQEEMKERRQLESLGGRHAFVQAAQYPA